MKLPIQISSTLYCDSRVAIAASILAIGFGSAVVNAQTTSATAAAPASAQNAPVDAPGAASTSLTDAQLREQITALRKEIVQLQHAQKLAPTATASPTREMAMAKQGMKKCKDGMNMGMQVDGKTGCMGMPADTTAKGAADTSMKKKGMGMMEKEHSMPMPAPDTGALNDPSAAMPDKKCC
jgi:hypothetical protein